MSFLTLPQWIAELGKEVAAVEVKTKIAQESGVVAGIADAKSRVAVDTGATRDSIGPDGEGGYGADTDYAGFLEFGTSNTAPQPFIGPSADRAETVFVAGIVATIGP
jgi:HK97 gp10 family phage protein